MIIQFCYISMFALAVPVGAVVGLINNLFEIRMRVFSHLNVLERP